MDWASLGVNALFSLIAGLLGGGVASYFASKRATQDADREKQNGQA